MAQYHEGFWIAVATAGPVIALAHAVSVERTIRIGLARAGAAPPVNLRRWIFTGRFRQNKGWTKGGRHPRGFRQRLRLVLSIALWNTPYLSSALGFTSCVVATDDALACLRNGKALASARKATHLIDLALWTLLSTAILAVLITNTFRFPANAKPTRQLPPARLDE